MATERLEDFPVKATPVLADIIYTGNSANANDEVQITIQSLINVYPSLTAFGTAALVANSYFYLNNSSAGTVGTITPIGVALLAQTSYANLLSTIGALPLSGGTLSGILNMGGYAIQNVATPVNPADAVTKAYVDASPSGSVTTGSVNAIAYYPAATPSVSPLTTANNAVLITSNTGVPSLANTLPALVQTNITQLGIITAGTWHGSLLTGTYGGTGVNNAASLLTYAANVTFAGAFASTFTLTATTNLTFPNSGTLATTSQLPTFPLSIPNGGTGVSSVTQAPTAMAFAGWDSNANLSANRFVAGYATTATAGSTTTLSVSSAQQQFFTGTSNQTVSMPSVSSPILALGDRWMFSNNSTGTITINSSGGNLITTLVPGAFGWVTCISQSGTGAASWQTSITNPSTGSGTVSTGTVGTLAYYAANGTTVAPLTLGTNLSITGSTLNAASGGSGTITASPQFQIPYYTASGTASTLGGLALPSIARAMLWGNTGAAPSYAPYSMPSTLLSPYSLLVTSSSSAIGLLLTTANSTLITGATGSPQYVSLSTGQFLIGGTPPSVAPYTLPSTTLTANGLLYASSTTTVAQLNTVNYGMLVCSSAGVPSFVAPLSANTSASSPVTLTNNTPANIVTIPSVPIGKYIAVSNLTFVSNTGTCSFAQGWVSTTSASQPTDSSNYQQSTSIGTANNNGFTVIGVITVTTAGNVYLSSEAGFSAGLAACGNLNLIPI